MQLEKTGIYLEFDEHGEPRRRRTDPIRSRLQSERFENVATIVGVALECISRVTRPFETAFVAG